LVAQESTAALRTARHTVAPLLLISISLYRVDQRVGLAAARLAGGIPAF
jgi:hypothetical protein